MSHILDLSRPRSLLVVAGVVGCAMWLSASAAQPLGSERAVARQPSAGGQAPIGVQEPAWAPDGKRIAVSYLDRIWTMTPDGKQAKPVVSGDVTSIEREPAWSSDGNRIAFAADRGGGFDLFVVNIKNGVASGPPTAVTTMPGDERWPSWTSDGRLVFAHRDARPSGRNGDPSLQYDLFLASP